MRPSVHVPGRAAQHKRYDHYTCVPAIATSPPQPHYLRPDCPSLVQVLPVSTQEPRILREQQVHVPSTAVGPGAGAVEHDVGVRLNARF